MPYDKDDTKKSTKARLVQEDGWYILYRRTWWGGWTVVDHYISLRSAEEAFDNYVKYGTPGKVIKEA